VKSHLRRSKWSGSTRRLFDDMLAGRDKRQRRKKHRAADLPFNRRNAAEVDR
jgi:hypothetical protein